MIGIVLLGESNSGKSTIAKGIINKTGFRYISSGDIARRISSRELLDSGHMADEDTIRREILNEINKCNESFILDGFPRFFEQYEWLNQSVGCEFIYIVLDVPYEEIKERAYARGRSDDKSLDVKHEFWQAKTKKMIEEIVMCGELVYTFDNSNNSNIYTNVEEILDAMEGVINADNSEI